MQLWGTSLEEFNLRQWSFLSVDNNTDLGVNDGAEMRAADFTLLFQADVVIPILCYMLLWYSVNMLVNNYCWTTMQEGLKRKRLVNVTTSLIHSSLSGLYFLIFFIRFTHLMFSSPLHYYGYLDTQIIMFSIGYFLYDAIDLLINDKISIQTGVLLFHHAASVFTLVIPLCSKKFLLFAYWALLMEVSSIFLHMRSIVHIGKLSTNSRYREVTKIVLFGNLGSFVVFRILLQMWMITWVIYNRNNMHSFYVAVALLAECAFFLINIGLFLRILYSDGFMGSTKVSRSQLDALLEDNEYAPVATEDSSQPEKMEA